MAKHHLTRKQARKLDKLAMLEAIEADSIKHSLHVQAIADVQANRRHKPRKRPSPKWKGFASPSQSLRTEPAKVTAAKAAELEADARKHFGS